MKVWITKYALTKGILEKEAEECGDNTVIVKKDEYLPCCYHTEGKEWHRTKESAIQRAEEMCHKKIESLKKQIENLEKMKFE